MTIEKEISDENLIRRFSELLYKEENPTRAIEILEESLSIRNTLYDENSKENKNGKINLLEKFIVFLGDIRKKKSNHNIINEKAIERAYEHLQEYIQKDREKTLNALNRIYDKEEAERIFNKIYKV